MSSSGQIAASYMLNRRGGEGYWPQFDSLPTLDHILVLSETVSTDRHTSCCDHCQLMLTGKLISMCQHCHWLTLSCLSTE